MASLGESPNAQKQITTWGFTEVFSSPEPQVADIVFVHGLNGNPEKTWTADNGVFWPRDLLPKHLGDVRCRILTYGYDARVSAFSGSDGVSKDHIHHHAENLAAKLYSNRSLKNAVERPIIFVVHSLGGLVAKQCLIYSRSIEHQNSAHLRSIYLSTYGILFMGTPHNGSDLAKWGSLLQSIASATLPRKLFDSSSHLVEDLKKNNETLQNINRQFTEIMPRLHVFYFYEARPMDLKGTRKFVVDEDSAAPNFPGAERMGIERDHSTMCKFENAEGSAGFPEVAEAIRRYAGDAPEAIAIRWLEESHHRYIRQELGAPESLMGDRRSSRGTSPDSRLGTTPILPSKPNTPNLLENGAPALVTPWEVEEQEDSAKNPSSARLPYRIPAGTTNQSSPKSQNSAASARVPKPVRPRLVAPLGFRPNTHFIGFDIELARLVRKLADERRGQIGARSVLLYGPPGSGKSHIARQYVWQHVEEYPNGVFWIDCKTPESLNKGFWNVSQTLGCYDELQSSRPDGFIDAVRLHLAHQEKWLMVFDGIIFRTEDDLEAFKRYIPDGKGSSIIYTTLDRTLANRQRLLDPPGIKVYPLSIEQGCIFLYKSLHMREDRQPSDRQQKKARQLVKHYDGLPLGIHAAAHMLLARGRALEKYTPGPSDNRLAAPFISILDALERSHQPEAVNLLKLICFLNHEVPVAMLKFGQGALADLGAEICSTDRNGGSTRRELDNSIATLIRNGLIERRLQTQSTASSAGRSSPETTRALPSSSAERQNSDPPSRVGHEDTLEPDNDSQKSSATFVGIDVIQVHTVVQQVYLDYLRTYPQQDFNGWLTIIARFMIASWTYAHDKMKSNSGKGSVSDFREFESHAEKVWSHFPARPEGVSQSLRQARHDLHMVRRIIKREIDNQSPSQSSNMSGRQVFASIFEKSGSSSDEGPPTPTSGLSRITTWSMEPNVDPSESPVNYQGPVFTGLPLAVSDSWQEDNGYLSEYEQRPSKDRTFSSSTERALDERQHALRAIFEGKGSIEPWKPVPVVGSVSSGEIEPAHSRSNSLSSQTPRPGSSASLAEAALSAMHRISPTSSKTGYPSVQQPERRPLSEMSSNSPIGRQTSDPLLTRHSSTSPHLRKAVLTNTMRPDQLPREENISITRRSQPLTIAGRTWKPSLPTLESHSLPGEHGQIPMARDPSHESTVSAQTEPAENNSSIGEEYITPRMSPVDRPTPSPKTQPHEIETDVLSDGPPYPIINSPDTEPLPVLSPRTEERKGLGITND
ncbi:hypothetical protein LTR70_000944 [Exophiala xenobiotica]|uniref:Uncharacterized protein n=1 Tax=Lithohypha guttulata TaxID=1690604 RepID=A0ABR0KK13_9EURO|nr:hypothetical protein LTR24_001565 [Lithohypha guttulata]KAK5329108.1 hypothetical protein LTR70_000944 [Exophiala xenobiotica]